jgi:diguanylate cyclase (GGDEF)-like protein
MSDNPTIPALIDMWLTRGAKRLHLGFPTALEQLFEADTGRERCRFLAMAGLMAVCTALVTYPSLVQTLPDVAGLSRTIYLHGALPAVLLVAILMRLYPGPLLREVMQLCAILLLATCFTILFALSAHTQPALYVAGEMLLIVYCTLGTQLRFGLAALALALMLPLYGIGLHAVPAIGRAERQDLLLVAGIAGICALLANWRAEYGLRRLYLLTLREKLSRQSLSRTNHELNELAQADPLTGLANRRAYDGWLASVWAAALPQSGMVGLLVVDIDQFKLYNAYYGHAAGDICLQHVSRCLRDQLRGTGDLAARVGGEEFAALLPGITLETCGDIAERLRRAVLHLELPHLGLGPDRLVTISAGAASFRATPSTNPTALFDAADTALHAAKQQGRNRVCLATPASTKALSRQI